MHLVALAALARSSPFRLIALFATLLLFLVLSLHSSGFEVCPDGCTLLNLGERIFVVATRTGCSFISFPTLRFSLDTAWLAPFSMRFVVRNGLLLPYPALPLSLLLTTAVLYVRLIQPAISPTAAAAATAGGALKHRVMPLAARCVAALALVIAAHADTHAALLLSEHHGYNKHVALRAPALPPSWFESHWNCSHNTFASFGKFSLVSSGSQPCLLYKFAGTIGLDRTDCDVIQISDGLDRAFKPYGPFWKRAIFLKEAAKGRCLDSGTYVQWLYSDNDNILDYSFQDNLTSSYNAVRRSHFGTGLNAVSIAPGHSQLVERFATEWLSFHNHERVVGKSVHDLMPFREHLGTLNDFPGAINEALNLEARHCARHTVNRHRCVRGGQATPNLELQIVNDVAAAQLLVGFATTVLGWRLPAFPGGKADSVVGCASFALRTVLTGLLLGLGLAPREPLSPRDVSLKTIFKVTISGRIFAIGRYGEAFRAGMVVGGDAANGFVPAFNGVGSTLAFCVMCVLLALALARAMRAPFMWDWACRACCAAGDAARSGGGGGGGGDGGEDGLKTEGGPVGTRDQ